ncbi:MAG: exonuclease domain-containing protein [Patescibacteria group bacterium]
MKKYNLAFIDVETTGFDPNNHEIIEIGGVLTKPLSLDGGLETITEFEYKIKPEKIEKAEPQALRVNGYNEAEWLFAPTLDQVMPEVAEKTAGAIMVAHNLVFDWRFLNQAFIKTGIENKMHYAKLDTISVAFAKLFKDPVIDKFNLGSLNDYFGIKNEKAHTALADAKATLELYQKLMAL